MLLCRDYPVPENEALRLQELERLGIWRTRPEPVYDAVVALAASMFDTQICVLSFIGDRVQWFKAKAGIDADEVDRTDSFCSYAIMSPDIMVVPDAREDPRFRSYPAVTGPLAVRFYAAAPIACSPGRIVGTLCVADPRADLPFGAGHRACLSHLAGIVAHQLNLRAAPDRNRRATPRHPYCADCVVSSYGKRPQPARMVDLSEGGAMIEVDGSLYARGDEVVISIGALAITASVAWADGQASGVSFHGHVAYENLLRIRDHGRRH